METLTNSIYITYEQTTISRAEFEANFMNKIGDASFTGDINPLLLENLLYRYDFTRAAALVLKNFISRLPGEPWKGIETEENSVRVIP